MSEVPNKERGCNIVMWIFFFVLLVLILFLI